MKHWTQTEELTTSGWSWSTRRESPKATSQPTCQVANSEHPSKMKGPRIPTVQRWMHGLPSAGCLPASVIGFLLPSHRLQPWRTGILNMMPTPFTLLAHRALCRYSHAFGRRLGIQRHSNLGCVIHVQTQATGTCISYFAARSNGVCPPKKFAVASTIAAARVLWTRCRFLMKQPSLMCDLNGTPESFWTGTIQQCVAAAVIAQFLRFAMTPVFDGHAVILTIDDVQIPLDSGFAMVTGIQDGSTTAVQVKQPNVLRLFGGGAKQQQRNMQQSALASIMLEHGFDLSWISSATDQLLVKFSTAKLQHVTLMPPGPERIQGVLNLLKKAKIDVPEILRQTSRKEHQGMPWQPKKKRYESQLNPQEFQLVPNFFRNQDGTTVTQLMQFQPQTSGVCIMLREAAAPFLRSERLSTDELAILVLGNVPDSVTMPHQPVKFPCLNADKQMVILSALMFQLGAKDVLVQQGNPEQVKTEHSTLLALTLFRQDWNPEEWATLTTKPIPFLRMMLSNMGFDSAITSILGKSLRNGKATANPHTALTVQLHWSVLTERLPKFLMKSGFDNLFATPKTTAGRLDQSFKIIWLRQDESEASILAVKAPGCLGLVRGKSSLGLRFAADEYEKAWMQFWRFAFLFHCHLPLLHMPGAGSLVASKRDD